MPYAQWPPSVATRTYHDKHGNKISGKEKGESLPSCSFVKQKEAAALTALSDTFVSTSLFTDLPPKFFQDFLKIQNGSNPIVFPAMGKDKGGSVRSYMQAHPAFQKGSLNPNNWEELGWSTKKEYEQWLDTSMLFAFSHCNHYCSALRIFEADRDKNNSNNGSHFYFKQSDNIEKRTNILSVSGFEFRGFPTRNVTQAVLSEVEKHSKLTMQQILSAAESTQTTDIVLIPFGMGVFIKGHPNEAAIRNKMMAGMVEALKEYKDRPVSIHSCGWTSFNSQLKEACASNPRISLIPHEGEDAYTIANDIQDRGNDNNEMEDIPANFADEFTRRQKKSLLINAGDSDWLAMLDNKRGPGQCWKGHTLYHNTSDEYFALVTDLALHSVQNLIKCFADSLDSKIFSFANMSDDFKKYEKKFFSALDVLKLKTDELIERGKENAKYKEVALKAGALFNTLKSAGEVFFNPTTPPTIESLKNFREECKQAIELVEGEFKKHRGIWGDLHPVLKAILGILAAITIAPAIIVQATTEAGFVGTFFKTPPTDSMKKLGRFAENLDEIHSALEKKLGPS